ncbi:hypothetical protein ACIF8T_35600 [Streptomyces sp. NPDC085946]|uniref:hypothetical protein n=1 Tax=Streptomyces sp. NPDC085946 TaxID=3365744 RepID=UPI0037D53798
MIALPTTYIGELTGNDAFNVNPISKEPFVSYVKEPAYNPDDPQSGRALVDYHLRDLGLGEVWQAKNSGLGLRAATCATREGIGVCRAFVLTEAAWPKGADLCVTVEWWPDAALRRDCVRGTLPAGAEEHWRERIAATAQALESRGFVVEPSRVRCSPRFHPSAEFLVYRTAAGTPLMRVPADTACGLPEPIPPHYRQQSWYPEQSPCDLVRGALREAGLGDYGNTAGEVVVRSITQTVWPPEADRCAWLIWRPAARFTRDPDTGVLPSGAEDHWRKSLARLHQALNTAGLKCRRRDRPLSPATDDEVHFLVFRTRLLP